MHSLLFFLAAVAIFEAFADGAYSDGSTIIATTSTTSRTRKNSIVSITNDEWSALSDSLSNDASLHGPINDSDYDKKCRSLKTDAYAISAAANGICMHAHECAYEFCLPEEDYGFDIPSYAVDVRTEDDISEVSLKLVESVSWLDNYI